MTDIWHILPWALLACLLTAAVEVVVLRAVRRRSLSVHLAALVVVPIVSVLLFVVAISGFMFTPQLRTTLISCALIALTVIPVAVVLGRRITMRTVRQEQERATERAVEDSRRQLVAWVSHDLRTPLAGIRAMSEAIEDAVVAEPAEVARLRATDQRRDSAPLHHGRRPVRAVQDQRRRADHRPSDRQSSEELVAEIDGVDRADRDDAAAFGWPPPPTRSGRRCRGRRTSWSGCCATC